MERVDKVITYLLYCKRFVYDVKTISDIDKLIEDLKLHGCRRSTEVDKQNAKNMSTLIFYKNKNNNDKQKGK